jgi:hypothetical protein
MAKKEPALVQIYTLIEEVHADDEAAEGGTKAALRRQRVKLSAISKLCKEARVEILKKMKD